MINSVCIFGDKKNANFRDKFLNVIKEILSFYSSSPDFKDNSQTWDSILDMLNKNFFANSSINNKLPKISDDITSFKQSDLLAQLTMDDMNFYLNISEFNSNENTKSKFIVQKRGKTDSNIPYFPLGTLHFLLELKIWNIPLGKTDSECNYQLTPDKVVIILEIATALKDLHKNGKFHGNLASNFIFISSKKDAYLYSPNYDRKKKEYESTELKMGPFYYRPPENISNNLIDIYSFGVLVHEIITETSPEKRMDKLSHQERVGKLEGDYFDFLFKNEKENKDLSDWKDIIKLCMDQKDDNHYKNFDDIINNIHKTQIYKSNKDEIEDRINKAFDSNDYECGIQDLFESYNCGYKESEEYIKSVFKYILQKFNFTELLTRNQEDFEFFTEIFNFIIQRNFHYTKMLKNSDSNNFFHNDKLLSFSKQETEKTKQKCILPICTLSDFFNKTKNLEHSLIFCYIIALELSIIHSEGLFHGDLSGETIGIYYNHEYNMFVPSVILFYHYIGKKEDIECSIESGQERDIIAFRSILEVLEIEQKIKEEIKKKIKEKIKEKIKYSTLLNQIAFYLFNIIIESKVTFSERMFNYESLHLSFPTLITAYSKLNIENTFINFGSIFSEIKEFLKNTIDITHEDNTIIENIGENHDENKKSPKENIENLIDIIIKYIPQCLEKIQKEKKKSEENPQ